MNTRPLCYGYMSRRTGDDGRTLETLYALCPDGRVMKSDESPISNEFAAGRTWSDSILTAAEVRAAFEFIGNYPIPAASREQTRQLLRDAAWRIKNLSRAAVPYDDPLDGPVLRAIDRATADDHNT